jgi:hypothetical protein
MQIPSWLLPALVGGFLATGGFAAKSALSPSAPELSEPAPPAEMCERLSDMAIAIASPLPQTIAADAHRRLGCSPRQLADKLLAPRRTTPTPQPFGLPNGQRY